MQSRSPEAARSSFAPRGSRRGIPCGQVWVPARERTFGSFTVDGLSVSRCPRDPLERRHHPWVTPPEISNLADLEPTGEEPTMGIFELSLQALDEAGFTGPVQQHRS